MALRSPSSSTQGGLRPSPGWAYDGGVYTESLEQIALRLGWSEQRLAEARAREAEVRPSNISDRDRARAEALAESVRHTRMAIDAVS